LHPSSLPSVAFIKKFYSGAFLTWRFFISALYVKTTATPTATPTTNHRARNAGCTTKRNAKKYLFPPWKTIPFYKVSVPLTSDKRQKQTEPYHTIPKTKPELKLTERKK